MLTLPFLKDIFTSTTATENTLSDILATLFEGSAVLCNDLVPQVATTLQASCHPTVATYTDLIDLSLSIISSWDDTLRAQFIAGHPRIGEVKKLSHLSSKEQASSATPPEVLARLAHLNACYEHRYPGLIYITFVNGRTRAAIMEELEDKVGLERSLSPDEPKVESIGQVAVGSEEWRQELDRAVQDVGRIAKNRLKAFGVE